MLHSACRAILRPMVISTSDFCERASAVLNGRGWMTRLASITGKDYSTVKRWAAGDLDVPGYAVTIVELLELVPAERRPERYGKPHRKRARRRTRTRTH